MDRLWRGAKALFRKWEAFSEVFGGIMMGLLFGACYLVLMAPFGALFRIWDPLRIRKRALEASSHWIERPPVALSRETLRRMG